MIKSILEFNYGFRIWINWDLLVTSRLILQCLNKIDGLLRKLHIYLVLKSDSGGKTRGYENK